jgi:negative regulator of flagellin synthesis FlgM
MMKIGQPSDNSIPSSTSTQSAATKAAQSPTTTAIATAAKGTQAAGVAVTMSSLARSLESTNRGQGADMDIKKVEAVKSAIQQGTYKVDAEAIADKLLSNAQEMLDRTRI